MTGESLRRHFLVVGGVLLVTALLGVHLGINSGTWWLLGAVVAVLHVGVFAALFTWVVRRARR